MSFTFTLSAPEPPDAQRIIDSLSYWDLHCQETEIPEGPWPEGTLHFYRDLVSTRGVEITLEENSFQVRILTLSSPEDYELALRFVEAAAEELQQPVSPEDYESIPVADLRERYTDDWIHQTNTHGAMVVRQLVQEHDTSVMTLYGSRRPIHIGPRVVTELEEAGPEGEFLDRLIEKMRQIQNVDGDDYFFANVMEAQRQDSEESEEEAPKFTFAVFGPTVDYLLPDAQFYALIAGEDEPPIFIPPDKLPLLLPEDSWDWLDERQMLVQAIDEDLWPAILKRARQFEVNPVDEA